MNGQNTTAAVSLATALLAQASTIMATVQAAQAEGRDLTKEELDGVFATDALEAAKEKAAIDAMPG